MVVVSAAGSDGRVARASWQGARYAVSEATGFR